MHAFLYVTPPAIALLLLFAIGELVVRGLRRHNIWLALIFLVYAFVLLRAFLLFSGWMSALPLLYEITLPANFWIGPLVYIYLRAVLDPGSPNSRALLWHLIPGLLVFPLVLPNALQPATVIGERIALAMELFDGATENIFEDPYLLLTPLALVHVAVYLGLLVRSMLLLLNLENLRRQETVRAFLAMNLIALISTASAFAGIATANRALVEFAIGLLALVVPLMYLLQKRYPDLFEILEGLMRSEREKRERYLQSQLVGVDLHSLERGLNALMDADQVYRQDDLTMPALADLLETTPHRLSEYLNAVQKTSFSDFINRRRVQAARELLVSRPQETVLSIAYDVGFNSKSAFNKAFARHAGVSPTRFRKQAGTGQDR